ncbi:hypothetical protein [uncultured Bacteroides sp.]|uniref:hypothetical protein n=1 Tax=uncultured Bacteroides sp. TaxID=162156 RepID=UPI002620142C|nr:hypothetical protein [uncultured Bacteroides sp.]
MVEDRVDAHPNVAEADVRGVEAFGRLSRARIAPHRSSRQQEALPCVPLPPQVGFGMVEGQFADGGRQRSGVVRQVQRGGDVLQLQVFEGELPLQGGRRRVFRFVGGVVQEDVQPGVRQFDVVQRDLLAAQVDAPAPQEEPSQGAADAHSVHPVGRVQPDAGEADVVCHHLAPQQGYCPDAHVQGVKAEQGVGPRAGSRVGGLYHPHAVHPQAEGETQADAFHRDVHARGPRSCGGGLSAQEVLHRRDVEQHHEHQQQYDGTAYRPEGRPEPFSPLPLRVCTRYEVFFCHSLSEPCFRAQSK